MIYRLPELSDAQSSGHSLSADPGSRICHLQADGCVLHRNQNLRGVSFFLFHLKNSLKLCCLSRLILRGIVFQVFFKGDPFFIDLFCSFLSDISVMPGFIIYAGNVFLTTGVS